jgi:uncharacterized Zn finger protein
MVWWGFKPYVPVAQRRANAMKEVERLRKKGQTVSPVHIEGRKIAQTFWGKAWCDNLESYSDFASRLPRGRTYVRNGSVCDLQIEPGRVRAMVCGSELYHITITIEPLPDDQWDSIKRRCAGQIGSLIELLQGKLSQGVMQIITERGSGLFPKPGEIDLDCSCPDWADMCKHVAAALYGVGARLDEQPELLFLLRKVDHLELLSQAGDVSAMTAADSGQKTIAADALADVFGIELGGSDDAIAAEPEKIPEKSGVKPTRRKRSDQSANGKKIRDAKKPPVKVAKRKKSKRVE